MSMLRLSRAQRKPRISVCVPTRDLLHAAFAFDLCRMLQHSSVLGIDAMPHFCMGTLIVNQRETLVQMARDAGSTHILWLDSDMMFPPDTLSRLLSHGLPVAAANYPTRQYPHKTVAYRHIGDWTSYVTHDAVSGQGLMEVEAIGMGCMLVDISVFDAMSKPLFQTTWVESSGDHMGEDFYFCQKARELGYVITVDGELSREVSHLGTLAFTHDMVRPGLT